MRLRRLQFVDGAASFLRSPYLVVSGKTSPPSSAAGLNGRLLPPIRGAGNHAEAQTTNGGRHIVAGRTSVADQNTAVRGTAAAGDERNSMAPSSLMIAEKYSPTWGRRLRFACPGIKSVENLEELRDRNEQRVAHQNRSHKEVRRRCSTPPMRYRSSSPQA